MAVTETGRTLAAIKEQTGLSWSAIADVIGASSGDYVRKVASGAKPGNNLATNVAELMRTGRVERAAPRRRTASGQVARVRASTSTGAPSRRPAETAVRAPGDGRRLFRDGSGRLGWAQQVNADDEGGMRAVLAAAGRGRRRVSFRVRVMDDGGRQRWVVLGEQGGYSVASVRDGIRKAGSLEQWLEEQLNGRQGYGRRLAVLYVQVQAV